MLPAVTVVMGAYNAERFVAEALESALAQDYPAEALDVVVVDDGSTDATAEIVAAVARGAGGRVRLVRQANAGQVGAFNAAIPHAAGELIALLDADDVWPADKIRRQVAALEPGVGLVYGDMTVIDADGVVLQESWLVGEDPPSGRCAGELLAGNPATASSILARADLVRALSPIPAEIPWPDWFLAVRAAQLAGIAHVPEPRTLYRFHGENMSLGAQGEARRRELVKAAGFQRWCLRRVDLYDATPAQLYRAWTSFERNVHETLSLAGSPFAPVVETAAAERATARRLTEAAMVALARGERERAAVGFLHAAACDPWNEDAREALLDTLAGLRGADGIPGRRPLAGARSFVVVAAAEEVLAAPALLEAFHDGCAGQGHVTLAVDASGLTDEGAHERLRHALVAAGLGAEGYDVVTLVGALDAVGRARLAAGAHAALGSPVGLEAAIASFGASDADALRALALMRRPRQSRRLGDPQVGFVGWRPAPHSCCA
jgi:hypothetical protein